MTSLSQLQSTLGEILDSTASLVQGRGRGGADGSLTWVDVVGSKRVHAKCFGRVAPGTCGVVQDRTGQWWAIGQGQGSVQIEQVQFYRHRARPTPAPESADVAVLLSCEKEDKYEFWITYLGNDRKDRFAFVGELPKVLQTEQYWAWEGEGFEFNPYMGATGGGLGASTTPNNYDGAVIEAGPQGAYYESEGRGGGENKGGIVTPKWTKVLSDYEITARTYLQTLCSPIGQYTDVTWEWSDGGGEKYALRKVPGDGVTTDSSDKKAGTRWKVDWSYEGGGGSVGLIQEEAPVVDTRRESPDDGPTYRLVTASGQEFLSQTPFTTQRTTRTKSDLSGVSAFYRFCFGDWGVPMSDPLPGPPYSTGLGSDWRATFAWNGNYGDWPIAQGNPFRIANFPGCGFNVDASSTFSTPTASLVFIKDNQPYDPTEYKLEVLTGGSVVYDSGWQSQPESNPFQETIPPPEVETYYIQVFDKDGIEVGSGIAGSPITHQEKKFETKRVDFFIRQDGENLGGRFDASSGPIPGGFEDGDEVPADYRTFEIEAGESAASVTGETHVVTAKIEAWVEVNEDELAKVSLDGKDGQVILESAAYGEATKPYKGPDGRTVYPCYPQRSKDPPVDDEGKFRKGDGFSAYHITRYVPYDGNGNVVDWEPFDFNNPDLSGYLPSPSINYLYSLISTDLLVSFDPIARLSWGADIPEEDPESGTTTNLEEEKIDGVDKNGVLYPLVKGFVYGLYGPIKASNTLLNQRIDKQAGQTLANYDMTGWRYRNRARKPRTYVLGPDDFEEGEPFEEFDVSDLNQRGLHQMQMTMGQTFRQSLWGYDLGPIGNESEEDWRHEAATFADATSGGSTPNQRRFFNDPAFNSSNVRQSGDKRIDIKVNMDDVKALLKATERKDVRFTVYPEGGGDDTEPTEKTFKMNPVQDVFEGYDEVKVLAVAGIIY